MLGVVVGWVTNALGMWLIFEPPEPRRILGIKVHGLFLRRQDEAAEVYAQIIADDVITLEHIGDFLLDGPRGDRTRQMLADGAAAGHRPGRRPGARRGPGRGRHARASTTSATRSPSRRSTARSRRSRTRSSAAGRPTKIRALIATRTKELPPRDFVEMMRSAIKEDEWMLYAHGAIMGFGGGLLHLALFGVGGRRTVSDGTRRHGRPHARRSGTRRPRRCPGWPGSRPRPALRSAAWTIGSGVRSAQAASPAR